jgi:phage terminase large subunit
MYTATSSTHKLLKLNKRLRGVAGGTSAGKTISILQILIHYAQTHNSELVSVVSESFPHLRRGAMRDFLNIMQTHHYFKDELWSRTDYTYTFETGSKIEFFSADQPGKVRGPRREILYINEANNIPYEAYDQLAIRTRKVIWLDWNPTNEFWWYSEVAPHYEHDFITLTYKDNEALDASIIQDIEAHQHNKNWWRVYGLGLLGEVEGKIYTNWKIIDDVPHEARLERRGLDFGYSNDPTAIVDVYYYNGGYILDEQLYRKGMSNKDLSEFVKNLDKPQTVVVADSAEPKSIDELKLYNLAVLPAQKGPGSLTQGIQYVQDQQISVTKRSVNLIKEYRNYLWTTDKDGRIINIPEGGNDHALDAIRYALETFRPMPTVKAYKPSNMLRAKHGQT